MTISMKSLLFAAALMTSISANAGVQVDRTRVIYPVGAREVSIGLVNKGTSPSLVQTWVDAGDPKSRPKDIKDVPFVVTPPLTRIDGGLGQSLRLSYLGHDAPTDRESLYYLNVLDIPAQPREGNNASTENITATLQFSVRNRFKVFLRPKGLPGSPGDAVKSLTWRSFREDGQAGLLAINPTPYYVSVASLQIPGMGKVEASLVVPPKGQAHVALPRSLADGAAFTVTSVNDYGAVVDTPASLDSADSH